MFNIVMIEILDSTPRSVQSFLDGKLDIFITEKKLNYLFKQLDLNVYINLGLPDKSRPQTGQVQTSTRQDKSTLNPTGLNRQQQIPDRTSPDQYQTRQVPDKTRLNLTRPDSSSRLQSRLQIRLDL
jgi:hypothetical protein